MKEMTANDDLERFRTGAAKYAAYLETPEGRLRLDLAFANLQDFLPQATRSLHALDIGGGTGAMAVRLARLGLHVTLLDASLPMLDFAKRAAQEAGVAERIALKHGDASQLANLFHAESFDVILCHNILEYVDDPCAVLRSAARALRDPSSIISVLVRNQAGEVLKAAIKTATWRRPSVISLLSGDTSLCTEEGCGYLLQRACKPCCSQASLTVTAERGVRVMSDYLPPKVSRSDEYERIFELERKLGRRPEFAAVARYTHCLAHRAEPSHEGRRMNSVIAQSSSARSRMTPDAGIALGLGLTNECNLACAFCYRDPTRADRLSLDQVKAVMERLPVRSVNLGTGENGMHPDFKAILAYLRTKPVKLTITSNGHSVAVLEDDDLRAFHDIEFSLDYATQAEQDAQRGIWQLGAHSSAGRTVSQAGCSCNHHRRHDEVELLAFGGRGASSQTV